MKSLKMLLFAFIAVLFTDFFLPHTIIKAKEPTWVLDKNTGCKVWLNLPPDESIEWSGECVNGKAHGNGTLIIFKNNIEFGKIYHTTKNGLTMVDGVLTPKVDSSSFTFSRVERKGNLVYMDCVIKGVVNKEINLSYNTVAKYILEKGLLFAYENYPKYYNHGVTILLYQNGEDNYLVRGNLSLTRDKNKLKWNEYENCVRDKRISEEETKYHARLAEQKRLEKEKKRQEMEARERQEEERIRQEMAARKAKEERERAEAIKRRDEFVKKNGVKEWPDISELSANPFVYDGQTIAIKAHFETMQTATQGIFGVGNAPVIVSDIPKGLFKEGGLIVVLAGRVLGKTELQVPLFGLIQVPYLKFVGVHFCKEYNCKDIIPE